MKTVKKVLSVVLAVAMLACSMAIAASADGSYVNVKTWGAAEFSDFAGNGLTSDADHAVLVRRKSVGWQGYGIYGMPSGGLVDVIAGETYTFEVELDYSGVTPNENQNALIADFYLQDYDYCVEICLTGKQLQEKLDEGNFRYSDDGVRYFVVRGDLAIPTEIEGQTVSGKVVGEARLWTRGFADYRALNMRVYSEDNPFMPLGEWNFGDMSTANDDGGIRTEPYIENSNYELPRGLRVYRGVFEAAKLALGGTKMNFAAGSYSANYSLSFDGVFCADDAVLATAKVKNAEGAEVATKDITKADLTRSIKDSNGGNTTGGFFDGTIDLAVPFTVEADGEYTAELYTTGLANLTVVEASFSAAIPDEEIKAVEDKIAAIGDVKYDPDKSEDSGELITAARDAYNALAEKYGDVSSMVDNFEVLTSAENVYANLKEEYDTMIENAATVDEAINAIEFPITKDSEDAIVTAEETRDSFIEYFGQEKADLHIKGLATLAKAREDFDKLSDVVYGDVNGDGEVTVADALMVLQHSVGKITLDESVLVNADVDSEEGIAVTDALAILQASVNKITLPIVK